MSIRVERSNEMGRRGALHLGAPDWDSFSRTPQMHPGCRSTAPKRAVYFDRVAADRARSTKATRACANVSRSSHLACKVIPPVRARQACLWIGITLLACKRSPPPGDLGDGAAAEAGASRAARLLVIENRRVAGGV